MRLLRRLSCLMGLALASLFASAVSGCGTDTPICTADVRPGIVVSVSDAQTGASLAARAVVTAQNGSYSETLRPFGFTGGTATDTTEVSVSGANERPGTYTVNVTVPGYTPYVANNVRVTKDVCHVRTVSLTAKL